MSFNDKLAAAAIRMSNIENYQASMAAAKPNVTITRGAFYESGPICLIVVNANGVNIASVIEESYIGVYTSLSARTRIEYAE